jgi:hypothetical protein
MNPKMKKFISLFLVFSLVMLSANLYAKERRGATLIVQRKSDQVEKTRLEGTPWETSVMTGIRGELIAIKQNSLLLLDDEGKDVSVDIEDIKVIRVVKKSQVGKGVLTGTLIGAGLGVLLGGMLGLKFKGDDRDILLAMAFFGAIGVAQGVLVGGIIGAVSKGSKTIQIEGMSDLEISEALDKLRKKARIPDYK